MIDRTMVQSMASMGITIPGEVRFAFRSATNPQYTYLRDIVTEANMHQTLAKAYAATQANRNDVVFITQEHQQLLATLDWAKYNVHLIGLGGMPGAAFQYPRFGQSDDFTPVITQSQWWGTWANMRISHGRGAAGNLVGVNLTGHYNAWKNIHLYSPGHATEGAVGATMMSLSLAGGNNYFEGCTLGLDTVLRAAANSVININTSGVCNVFKGCRIVMYQSAGTPYFIWCASGASVQNRWTYFEDCTFIAYSTNWGTPLTVAIGYNYSGDGHRLIFKDCGFAGVTDLIASGYENNVQMIGGNTYISADEYTGLTLTPDTTA